MGPNALPVPEITNGSITPYSFLETGLTGHIGKGDKTGNIVLNSIIRAGNKAALGLYFVPYEIYNMDTNTSRNVRNTRDYDGKGSSVGDVYIKGYFQIIENKTKLPDLMLTFGVRTASGNNLEAARFIDAPGYFFHLSAGKTKPIKNSKFQSFRYYCMAGMYAWQTYSDKYKQDDALVYGIGGTLTHKHFILDEQIGGYFGYLNDGDRPLVNRFSISSARDKTVNIKLLFQYGFADANYKSIIISSIFNLEKRQLKKQIVELAN